MLALLPLFTPCYSCYLLLPLLPFVTPCYPCYPLLPLITPCYPLLPPVTPCCRLVPLLPFVIPFYSLLPIAELYLRSFKPLHYFKIWLFPAVLTDFPKLVHVKRWKTKKTKKMGKGLLRGCLKILNYIQDWMQIFSFSWCFLKDFHTI